MRTKEEENEITAVCPECESWIHFGHHTGCSHHPKDKDELRSTKDGRIFGIKNLRFSNEGEYFKITADLVGDFDAAKEYLREYFKRLFDSIGDI